MLDKIPEDGYEEAMEHVMVPRKIFARIHAYAAHDVSCPVYDGTDKCSCGLHKLFGEVEALAASPPPYAVRRQD